MKALIRFGVAACAAALVALPGIAAAHGGGNWKGDYRDRYDHREFRHEYRPGRHIPPGHWNRHHHHRDVVVRERVYYGPVVRPWHAPAVVISIPPIVIPF